MVQVEMSGSITAQDVVRHDSLLDAIGGLQTAALALYQGVSNETFNYHHRTREMVEKGAESFAKNNGTRISRLKCDMALMRIEIRREGWKDQLAKCKARVEAVTAAMAELEAADALSALLGVCSE